MAKNVDIDVFRELLDKRHPLFISQLAWPSYYFSHHLEHTTQSTSYNFAKRVIVFVSDKHCVKSVRIQSFSGPYLVLMRENMDQKNAEYGHFSRSDDKAE